MNFFCTDRWVENQEQLFSDSLCRPGGKLSTVLGGVSRSVYGRCLLQRSSTLLQMLSVGSVELFDDRRRA